MAERTNESKGDDRDIFDALRHPLRRQVLRTMLLRETTTPKDIADELAEDLGNVSYHVRFLEACRVVDLVRGDKARAWERHFYEVIFDEPWIREALGIPRTSPGCRPCAVGDPEHSEASDTPRGLPKGS